MNQIERDLGRWARAVVKDSGGCLFCWGRYRSCPACGGLAAVRKNCDRHRWHRIKRTLWRCISCGATQMGKQKPRELV